MLAVGLALFGIASLACGLAQWPIMLIIARIVQGAAGAMVSPEVLAKAENFAINQAQAVGVFGSVLDQACLQLAGALGLSASKALAFGPGQQALVGRPRVGRPRLGR